MNHDQIIALVARQMTEAEPPSDLRARVMAALPTRTPHRWIRFAIPAGAAAALAIIALMSGTVWLERSKGPTVQGSGTVRKSPRTTFWRARCRPRCGASGPGGIE